MKSYHLIHRVIAVILMVMFFASAMCVGAFATNVEEGIYTHEVIGTLEDVDGILLPDPISTQSTSTSTLFTMTATAVYTLLTTYGVNGKSFTGGCMDGLIGEGLLIKGTLTTSLSVTSAEIKAGACYYQPSSDTFVSVAYGYFPSGQEASFFFSKAKYFSNSITYYGHITNNLGVGYVKGSLTYSVTTQ